MLHKNFFPAVILVAMYGCGGTGEPTGKVTGRITHEGTPLTEGTISFSSQDGSSTVASSVISADGVYDLQFGDTSRIPVGEYTITVHPPAPPLDLSNPVPSPQKEYPNFPLPYRSPATSPLHAVIAEGEQEMDFDLTTAN